LFDGQRRRELFAATVPIGLASRANIPQVLRIMGAKYLIYPSSGLLIAVEYQPYPINDAGAAEPEKALKSNFTIIWSDRSCHCMGSTYST
jgi:hypothetical protein